MKHYKNANCKINYHVKQVLTVNNGWDIEDNFWVLKSKFTTFTATFIKFLLIL